MNVLAVIVLSMTGCTSTNAENLPEETEIIENSEAVVTVSEEDIVPDEAEEPIESETEAAVTTTELESTYDKTALYSILAENEKLEEEIRDTAAGRVTTEYEEYGWEETTTEDVYVQTEAPVIYTEAETTTTTAVTTTAAPVYTEAPVEIQTEPAATKATDENGNPKLPDVTPPDAEGINADGYYYKYENAEKYEYVYNGVLGWIWIKDVPPGTMEYMDVGELEYEDYSDVDKDGDGIIDGWH